MTSFSQCHDDKWKPNINFRESEDYCLQKEFPSDCVNACRNFNILEKNKDINNKPVVCEKFG